MDPDVNPISATLRRLVGILILVLLLAGGVATWLIGRAGRVDAAPDDMFAIYCLPVPQAAIVDRGVPATESVRISVPRDTPKVPSLDASAALTVHPGDVVEFRVTSPRTGALAVHGLSELVRIAPETVGVVRFRAIYAGRFPLHFHGLDQSHFEVAVVEVQR